MATRAWAVGTLVLGLLACRPSGLEPAASAQRRAPVGAAPSVGPSAGASDVASAPLSSAGPSGAGPAPRAGCGDGVVYGQRLANPQLNGLGGACLRPPLGRQVAFDIRRWKRWDTPWLLMGDEPRWLVGTAGGYRIDLAAGVVVGEPLDRISWAAMLPSGRLATLRPEGLFVQRLTAREGPDAPTEAWAPASAQILGFFPSAAGFIETAVVMTDPPPCRAGFKCSGEPIPGGASVRAFEFAPRAAGPGVAKWSTGHAGCSAWAPFLRDGTAVLPCGTAVRWIAPGGNKAGAVPARLGGNLVSVDLDDGVLGFEWVEADVRLVRLTAGERTEVRLGPRRPVQPPMVLPGGRVVVICEAEVLSVRGQAVEWTAPLTESFHSRSDWDRWPVGTGAPDGTVLIKHGPRVRAFDSGGNVVWETRVDAPIESNPLLTSDGGVCVATAAAVHCALPAVLAPGGPGSDPIQASPQGLASRRRARSAVAR